VRLKSLTGLAVRGLRARPGRSLAAATGVALGVALFFGSLITTASGQRAFDRLIETSSGRADVIVRPVGSYAATLAPDVVSKARALPGVEAAVGVFALPTAVSTDTVSQEVTYNRDAPAVAVGVDPAAAERIYPFTLLLGRMHDAPDEAVVPSRLAEKLEIEPGDDTTIVTPIGNRTVRVTGVLADDGAGGFNQGNAVFLVLSRAQEFGGADGRLSTVFVTLSDGVEPETWIDEHRDTALPGLAVDTVDAAGNTAAFRAQILAATAALTVFGTALLFIAGFLIHLTLSAAVVERIRTYGTLQALGARRSQVRRVVLAEALVLGGSGTLVGLGLGYFVAIAIAVGSRRFLVGFEQFALVVRPSAVVGAVAVGLIVTVASALLPARAAARLDPVDAIRGDHARRAQLGRTWIAGAVSLAVGITILFTAEAINLGLAMPFLLFGSVGLLPPLLRPLARAVGTLTSKLARGVGGVAVLHLAKERTRSAYTLGLVMLVMGTTIAVGAANESFTRSFDRQITHAFGADLMLDAAGTFSPSFTDEVRAIGGVDRVVGQAWGDTEMITGSEAETVQVRFLEPAGLDVDRLNFVDGTDDDAREALGSGGTVIFPAVAAARLGVARGDAVTLRTSDGPRPFTIAATAEISNAIATLYLSDTDGRRYFGAHQPAALFIEFERGADPTRVRQTIERQLGAQHSFAVVTLSDVKADIASQIAGGLSAFWMLLVVAGVIGLLGLANTLAVSMLERYREIGLLRAIGARRTQVRAMALVESLTLVAVAFVLALPLGVLLSQPVVGSAISLVGDVSIQYAFPWDLLPILAVGGIVAAVVSSWGPARRAVRVDPDEALRAE